MKRALVLVAAVALIGASVAVTVLGVSTGLPDVRSLKRHAPRRTVLMREREEEARRHGDAYRIDQRWMPYGTISPLLRRAVLVAEDDAFYSHGGVDWDEVRAAARKNIEQRRIVRGGSTITQQLVKNLYVGSDRTPVRKLKEMLLALRLERTLTKRRIFELYLNLIEWGEGIYGAEAAARRYFGVSAGELGPRQCVLLAAVIINPRRYSVLEPSRRIEERARLIASRMRGHGYLSQEQYLLAIGRAPPAAPPWWQFWKRLVPAAPPEPASPPPETLEAAPAESLETGEDTL